MNAPNAITFTQEYVVPERSRSTAFVMPEHTWRHLRTQVLAIKPERRWFKTAADVLLAVGVSAFFALLGFESLPHSPQWITNTCLLSCIGGLLFGAGFLALDKLQVSIIATTAAGLVSEMDELAAALRGDGSPGGAGRDRGGLEIREAKYGAGALEKDVTDAIRSAIAGGSLVLEVTNSTMGGDPAPGTRKQLRVSYVAGDSAATREKVIDEGATLRLP